MTAMSWETIAAKKREDLASSIPEEWRIPAELLPGADEDDVTGFPARSGWFTAEELAITAQTAAELLPRLASGELSSEAVTRAFCKRAAAAHQLTNCLSETCFARALATARDLDARLAATGKPAGPLHGLPVSLKDNFNLRGLDATVGFVSHVGDPAREDAVLADVLAAAGAVFYVKTNVPTAMMMAETVNHVFGRTVNPRARRLTSGGSSGGESALVAFAGSPLGVGTDIGGSLRIPAACTGLFTLKPSFGRFPTLRCRSGMPGQEAVQSVNGPLARTLTDVALFAQTVVAAEPWHLDPRCLPIPWRAPAPLPPRLRVAVMRSDGVVAPTAPVARALDRAAARLAAAGHDVVEWAGAEVAALQARGLALLGRMFVADGGRAIRRELERSGEPVHPDMAAYADAQELGGLEYWRLHLDRQAFQKEYLDRWRAAGIDALLCPATPFAGVENGNFKHVGYTGVYNVLDYSSISFPTGMTADKSVDVAPGDSYVPLSELDKVVQSEYNPDAVHGSPINLQLVAQRLEEEKCIEMCQAVLDALS
ncbi:amidase [Hypoxylon sp. FL1284]|nr:amidase [Hypoxylon sp. FL1284]